MSGYLNIDQISGITLFVDHANDYTYGHLMRSIDLDNTMGANIFLRSWLVDRITL